MTDKELDEIELHVGYYRPEHSRHQGKTIITFFNPDADIRRLTKEVRRLKVEIHGGTSAAGIPEQGWEALVVQLKKRIGELESE